jgi:uncharacterized protein (DUF3820 family)
VEETPIYSSTKRYFTNTCYSLVDLGGRVPLVDLGEEFLWWSIGRVPLVDLGEEFLWWSIGRVPMVEHW